MESEEVPVNPFRTRLYSPDELLGGFEPDRPGSYADTLDFEAYRSSVGLRRAETVPYMHSIVWAIHDNSITQAIDRFVEGKMMVGIMGGHDLSRDTEAYARVARLAKMLSEDGYTVASGGGPGAMEATHLGAHLAGRTGEELDTALSAMAEGPRLPRELGGIIVDGGQVDEGLLEKLHHWQRPAFEVAKRHAPGAESLAIPTWHYGHEPPTPIASHIAKYFQNSIREEGLLALAKWGVIFTEGRAGTIQEIFQDATQNYYRSHDWFSPMVLLGIEYWTKTYPVVDVLRSLFDPVDQADCLTVTDDLDEAVHAIRSFTPRV